MSEVTPPPPPPPSPPSSAAAQPKAVVANPPEVFARQIALGARLEATITSTPQKGQFEIQTPFGRVLLQTTAPLPSDGTLQLQLQSKGAQLQFLITTINGQPPLAALRAEGLLPPLPGGLPGLPGNANTAPNVAQTPVLAQGSVQGATTGGLSGAAATPASAPLTVGATLSATLLNTATPVPGGQPLPSNNPVPGALVTGTPPGQTAAVTNQPPAPGVATTPSTSAPAQQAGTTPQTPSSATSASPTPVPATSQQGLASGTLFSVRITAFQPSPAVGVIAPTPTSLNTPAPGTILTGTVTGTATPSGNPVVLTHAGSLAVATRTPLPIGSQVTFEVVSLTPPSMYTAGISKPQTAVPPQILTRQWPALQDAVHTLVETNPAAAQQLIQAVLPQPGSALGGNILFFMMALTGGNIQNWFGDAPSRALQRIKPDLMARLKDDFGRIDSTARESGPGEWRSTLVPLHSGADINPIRLSLRQESEDDDSDGQVNNKGTRFVIDLELTRLGRFQLDGIVQRTDKHMDLIVRSERRLSDEIEAGIRNIFQEAGDVTGLTGGIVFQAGPTRFVEVPGGEAPGKPVGLFV